MNRYKVRKSGKWYHIHETGLEDQKHLICMVNDKNSAYRLSSHLNLGGGFDGNTPYFFHKTPVRIYK